MDSTALVVIGSTVLLTIGTAIGGIFVTLINVWLSERIKKANQDEIERLKIDLGKAAFEYQTRFARLHERRVGVIAELYQTLVATEMAFNTAMFPLREGPPEEEIDRQLEKDKIAAVDAMNRFVECFRANEVWLDEALASRIEALERALREAWGQFTNPGPLEGRAWRREAWRRVASTEVPPMKAEIRDAMREMLGVVPEPPEPTPEPSAPWWRGWWPW
jgi:hypothetical protein